VNPARNYKLKHFYMLYILNGKCQQLPVHKTE
jgi:hypothetical protein